MDEQWTFPQVEQGDRVYVAKHPSQLRGPRCPDRRLGIVVEVLGETCNILGFVPGADRGRPWMSCRHVDDPIVTQRPAIFEDPHFGVFALIPAETNLREMDERVSKLEEFMAQLSLGTGRAKHAPKPPRRKPQPVTTDAD